MNMTEGPFAIANGPTSSYNKKKEETLFEPYSFVSEIRALKLRFCLLGGNFEGSFKVPIKMTGHWEECDWFGGRFGLWSLDFGVWVGAVGRGLSLGFEDKCDRCAETKVLGKVSLTIRFHDLETRENEKFQSVKFPMVPFSLIQYDRQTPW
jgi:hypothetical protein